MIERCPCCIGKKTIIGLGALIKECPKCKGVGHVKSEKTPTNVEIICIRTTDNKPRGRPKKVNHEQREA